MKGTCKLCLKENVEMHKDCHIIPKFFYKMAGLFSENATMFYPDHNSGEANKWKVSPSKKGEYEQYIFCTDCEKLLGTYEDYAGKLFGNELKEKITQTTFKDPEGVEYLQYGDVNYKALKLFVYSLFWRASISSREIFNLKLEANVEEDLRKAILTGSPGASYEYPVNFIFHLRPKFAKTFHVSPPQFAKKGLYHFYHGGVFSSGMIIELITEVDLHLPVLATALRENNKYDVFVLNEEDSFHLYTKVLRPHDVSDEDIEAFRVKFQNDNKSKGEDYLRKTASVYNNPPLGYFKNRKKSEQSEEN